MKWRKWKYSVDVSKRKERKLSQRALGTKAFLVYISHCASYVGEGGRGYLSTIFNTGIFKKITVWKHVEIFKFFAKLSLFESTILYRYTWATYDGAFFRVANLSELSLNFMEGFNCLILEKLVRKRTKLAFWKNIEIVCSFDNVNWNVWPFAALHLCDTYRYLILLLMFFCKISSNPKTFDLAVIIFSVYDLKLSPVRSCCFIRTSRKLKVLWLYYCREFYPLRKVEHAANKVLIKHLSFSFLLSSNKFLPISFKIQLLETSPQKQKEQRQNQADVSFFWCVFPSWTFSILCNLLYCLHFAKFVCLLKRLQRFKQEWQKSPAETRKDAAKTRFGLKK
jgi:hypothetical protein